MIREEEAVLSIFRNYRVTPYQMLFLSAMQDTELQRPMSRLIEKGWVAREKPRHAYHLTPAGYEAMRAQVASNK